MTMDANELRALADALSVPHRDLATVDVMRAADYLRAQADAQPVPAVPQAEPKREPTEAQIEAGVKALRDRWQQNGDGLSDHGYVECVLRAALAAKETKEDNDAAR